MTKISTPCVGICQIDPDTGLCRGCHRNRAEIAAWASMSEQQRLAIMRTLNYRHPGAVKPHDRPDGEKG